MSAVSMTRGRGHWVGLILVTGVLALAAACKPKAQLEAGPNTALGQVAADVTAELLKNQGRVVLMVSASDVKPVTGTGAAVAAFQEQLKSHGMQVETVELLPATDGVLLSGMEPVSAAQFLAAYAKHATADAIVSFVGAPKFDASQVAQLPTPRPKFIAAVTFSPPPRTMFTSGVIQVAILARTSPQPAPSGAGARELFDANYQLIRADDLGGAR